MVEANKADDSGKDNGQFEDLIDGKQSTSKYLSFSSPAYSNMCCGVGDFGGDGDEEDFSLVDNGN